MTFHTLADAAPAIRRLRDALRRARHATGASTFAPVVDLFFDLCETPGFHDISAPCHDALVLRAVSQTAADLLRRETSITISGWRLGALVHGSALGVDAFMVYFWFHDLGQGMLVRLRPDGDTDMVRMSAVAPTSTTPSA
jgi:hypothetical protein